MPFSFVKVKGTFKDPTGKAQNGTIEILLSNVMINGKETIEPSPIRSVFTNGKFEVTLAANNDPATLPINSIYTFNTQIYGTSPGTSKSFKTFVPTGKTEIDYAELLEQA